MITHTTYIEYLLSTPKDYACTYLASYLSVVGHDQVNQFLYCPVLPANQLRNLIQPLLRGFSEAFLLVDYSVQDKR